MLEMLPSLLAILVAFLFSFFFSASETTMLSLNRLKLRHRAEGGDARAVRLERLLSNHTTVFAALLIGNNLANVTAVVATNHFLERHLGFTVYQSNLAATFGLTLVLLVCGEIIPKTIFQRRADEMGRRLVYPVVFFHRLFTPIGWLVNALPRLLLRIFRRSHENQGGLARGDVELLAEIGVEDGTLSRTACNFIHSVLSFGKTTAREIMTPLVDVVASADDRPLNAVVRMISESGYSRIPVFREKAYDMLGYVSAFDLLSSKKRDSLRRYLRPAVFVPETKRIDSLLLEMRRQRVPLVFVVDEWGGTAGIVTHEDLAEHIVGQIRDLGEKIATEIREVAPGEYLVDGWTDVDLLGERLGIIFEKQGFETVAGLVEYLMQSVPAQGETLEYQGYRIVIEDADKTTLKRLRFVRQKTARLRRSGGSGKKKT